MYTKQTVYRAILIITLFVPIFMHAAPSETLIEVFEFLLALVGIRSIAFFLFPEHKEN